MSSVSEPRWSPDGRYLAFLSDREGATKVEGAQVWLLDRRGGEAHQLTAIKDKLDAYEWSPDSKKLLLTITEIPEPKKEKEKDKKAKSPSDKDADNEDEDKPKPIVIDRYHFKQDVDGYLSTESRPSLLYLYDIEIRSSTKLPPTKSSMSRRRVVARRQPDRLRQQPRRRPRSQPQHGCLRRRSCGQIPSHGN